MRIDPSEMNDAELVDLLRDAPADEAGVAHRLLRSFAAGPPRVDRFEVRGVIGAGTTAIVYNARDTETDEPVALKLLTHEHELGDSVEDARARLLAEPWIAGELDHPAIVRVHATGVVGDRLYLAMDRIEGFPLDRWRDHSAPDGPTLLAALRDAGEGLAAIHAAGHVHRALEPSNILVDRDDRAHLVDCGLAIGAPATPASDQYDFCRTAAQLLAIDLDRGRSTLDAIPRHLCAAILRGLEPEPLNRWPDMDSLLAAMVD